MFTCHTDVWTICCAGDDQQETRERSDDDDGGGAHGWWQYLHNVRREIDSRPAVLAAGSFDHWQGQAGSPE